MPRTNKNVVSPKKQKLSPAERSQIAKDRWAKIRKTKAAQGYVISPGIKSLHLEIVKNAIAKITEEVTPAPPIVEQEPEVLPEPIPVAPPVPVVEPPVAQLATVKPVKQKRYTGPKEFSVALKAAEARLAKAIVERAQAAGQLAALQAEIPSLLGIINALKGSGNYVSPAPVPNFIANDFQGNYFPNALSGGPNPAPVDPMDAIRAAMAAPPVSRAIGNAVQLSPDVVGTLEGPDDDNPDRFLTGEHAGGGWIGG